MSKPYHPVDPEAVREPFGPLAEIRRTCPVVKLTGEGLPPVTLVSRYTDARSVYRDYRSFGNIGFYPSLAAYEAVPDEERTIIDVDPPRHTPVRRLNLLAMKPAAVDLAVPTIFKRASELVGDLVATGGGDVVGRLAVPLPAEGIATVLGLPASDAAILHQWVATLFSEPSESTILKEGAPIPDVDCAFDDYISDQIQLRKQDPGRDDAIARMVEFRKDDGTAFSDDELRIHVRTMLMAGNETTTSLLSNAVYRLATVEGVQSRLRADRSLLGPFIEECLRMDPPLTQFARRCMKDTSVGDVEIERDEVVSISIQSANRDESTWGDAAEIFDVDRFVDPPADHLSFGLGAHFCIGSYLARKTAIAALEALLDLTSSVELEPGYVFDRVWFFEFWRPKRLDVVLRPAS